MSNTILRTKNYYTGIDPNHYYRNSAGAFLEEKATRATTHKNVYLSDLLNNEKCPVTFSVYRDTDNKTAAVKGGQKSGIVRSYNPETNLVAIDCVKKRPSRISTMFKRTNKMRYVEPEFITVSSISRSCALRRVKRASSASPKASKIVDLFDLLDASAAKSRGSPKSPKAGASPRSTSGQKAITKSRGGKRLTQRRLTRKRRQTRN